MNLLQKKNYDKSEKVYPKKISLFTKAKGEFVFPGLKEENKLIGNKRRRNKEDDIRRMIGRRFFNDIVLNLINEILKNAGCIISFEKIHKMLYMN